MSFPRYAAYKDSGVEWLGEVPEGWLLSRHKFIASFHKGKNPTELFDTSPSSEALPYLSMDFLRGSAPANYAYPTSNSVISSEKQALIIWDGSNAGEFVIGIKGIVSSTMAAAIVRKDFDQGYYWFYCQSIESEIRNHARGMGIPHVNGDELKSIYIFIPSIQEQTTIAAFLDCETAKIDNLINEQKKLIELLKEKRQAVISTAVTKGLNPLAPMKDSGVEWLGEVPEHWGLSKVKAQSSLISKGTTPTTIGAEFVSSGIRFLKAENIAQGIVNTEPEFYISQETHQSLSRSMLNVADVLVVIAGATAGKSAVLTSEFLPANTNQAISFIRPLNEETAHYIHLWLTTNGVQKLIQLSSVQSAQPNLSMEDLGNIPITIPTNEEIKAILAFLDQETAKIDNLIQQAQKATTLLQERRTALISAAVTGKIDVRNKSLPASLS